MNTSLTTSVVTANPQTALELTDNIPVGTYVLLTPLEGPQRFTFLSKRWLEMTNLDPAKVMTDISHYFTVVHPEDRAAAITHNIAGNAAGVRYFWEGRWLQDGKVRWVTIESNPRRLDSGETVWEGVVTDITSRKQAESQLLAAKERFHAMINHLPIPAATSLYTAEQPMIFVNEAFTRTFGYTLVDCPTMSDWARCAYPDETYRKAVCVEFDEEISCSVLEKRPAKAMEYCVTCKDGAVRHALINCLVVDGMLFGSFLDVTEQRRAEAAREKTREHERKVEEAQRHELTRKLKTSLTAAAVAHEINQPLSSILLNVQLALERGSTDKSQLQSLAAEAQFVVTTIERMKVLLRNVKTGHRPVNIGQVVKSSLFQVDQLITARGVTLTLDIEKHGGRVKGDAEQLQLAIVNILRNAVEAVAACARREIAIEVKTHKKHVEIVVGDSGPGWPATLPGEAPLGSTKHGGSGIGLFVVRTAVKNPRGKIDLGRSHLGGAAVRISLPAKST